MNSRYHANGWIRFGLSLLVGALLSAGAGNAWALECTGGSAASPTPLPPAPLADNPLAPQPDLVVKGYCAARLGSKYYYGAVNILDGGTILFGEMQGPPTQTEFWASSIIIENGGTMEAKALLIPQGFGFGLFGGTLTIYLYGGNHGSGAPCVSPGAYPCGIPERHWRDGQTKEWNDLPGGVTDYFYKYGTLHGDEYCTSPSSPHTVTRSYFDGKKGACVNAQGQTTTDRPGYFGGKVLAVSYGGTLDLKGYKASVNTDVPEFSGSSWMRLADGADLQAGAKELVLERDPFFWAKDDEIVLTTTDYLPSHSEKLKIVGDNYRGEAHVRFRAIVDDADSKPDAGLQWPHNGTRYGGPKDVAAKRLATRLPDRIKQNLDRDLVEKGAETRAAVALLTRSIRIVSGGDTAGTKFGHSLRKPDDPNMPYYYYGAHMVVRQGFKRVAVQGVEFAQMGQGGRLGHYPVHFHMARKTPRDNAYIKDSSINESMTRWIVLHSTQGVTVARNVGYKSIGHGFYLEDGTETDNRFHSNIGIFARAAVDYDWRRPGDVNQNPRLIAGILADNQDPAIFTKQGSVANQGFPYRSDAEYPSVFWITNGWNDFIGNMAAGAGTCGAAYWLVPAASSDMIEVSPNEHEHMKWSGYAAFQGREGAGGAVPLRTFSRNYATSTMFSIQTTGDAPACNGVIAADAKPDPANRQVLRALKSFAPPPKRKFIDNDGHSAPDNANDTYYPRVFNERKPTKCPWAKDGQGKDIVGEYDCSTVPPCGKQSALGACTATVIDRFTSSFHWAEGTVSAVWLRPQWYLLTNSVITDVQNGGLTFVSGGDYTQAIQGYWALVKNTLFVGNTVDNAKNVYSRNIGPFNVEPATKLLCDRGAGDTPNYCLSAADTITMPVNGFMTNQRLSNIYDGPSYQDSNAYLDIKATECTPWVNGVQNNCMYGSSQGYLRLRSTRPEDPNKTWCYLPHAAIGWKQPNAFYYPPSFHSKNLFFGNVDLRHYVIDPLFKAPDGVTDFGQGGTYLTNTKAVTDQYCLTDPPDPDIFKTWTSIDRQTELNDDDGTLTGLTNSVDEPALKELKQTISVNEDMFFNAPVETAECASAVGDNATPARACKPPLDKQSAVTAKTSPYDYVSTVIYHIQGASPDLWDVPCNNETCYGVPLYRQYLAGNDGKTGAPTREWKQWFANKCNETANKPKPQCRWPFIRMAGAGISQRNTMTVNNGRYYLDTTASKETQQSKEKFTNNPNRLYNVFTKNQTYQVFFVYAKDTTAQTYQIYVGDGFDQKTFKPIRVDITNFPLGFNEVSGAVSWAKIESYEKGVLTVRINFAGVTELKPTPTNGLCQPRSFCKPKDATTNKDVCVSALSDGDPLKPESDLVCGSWAVKDLDCPASIRNPETGKFVSGGCFGFSFTLPGGFEANDTYHRPDPIMFPSDGKDQGKPDWTTQFKTLTSDKAGAQCTYAEAPKRDCIP